MEEGKRPLSREEHKKNSIEADFSAMREKAQEEWELRASKHNKYRKIWQKLFGMGETTATEIAIEKAIKMDEEIQKQIKTGKAKTIKGALRNIVDYDKFIFQLRDKRDVQLYSIISQAMYIGKKIENNDFPAARLSYFELRKMLRGEDQNTKGGIEIENITHSFLRNKIEALLDEEKIDDFANAIFFCGSYLVKEDLHSVENILKLSDSIDEVKIQAGHCFLDSCKDSISIHTAFKNLENFEELEILDREEIFQHPAVRQAVEKKIMKFFESLSNKPSEFVGLCKIFHNFGVMLFEEITELPDLRQAAKDKLTSKLLAGDQNGFSDFGHIYKEEGILDDEEIKKIPLQVKEASASALSYKPNN